MAPGRQAILTQAGWEGRARRTRRAEAAGPSRAVGDGRGRQPWPAETPPGTRPARCWPDLSDVVCEDACHDSLSVRDFVGCRYGVPDACDPRGLLPPPGESDVGRALLGVVVARPGAAGLAVRGGSVAGATTMEAPSPPENASGSRDPGTRLAKRGNQ